MQEKKLRDYLHYYISQQVKTFEPIVEIRKLTPAIYAEIMGISEACVLLLLPIEDITAEQFEELKGVRGHPNRNATLAVVTSTAIGYEYTRGGYRGLSGAIQLKCLSPLCVAYLLGQGFDIFSLIAAGLAIDKKTVHEIPLFPRNKKP